MRCEEIIANNTLQLNVIDLRENRVAYAVTPAKAGVQNSLG